MSNHWSPFYWRDYMADTGHLTLEQHGAYLLLMAHYYTTGKPLSANASILHRVCRAFAKREQDAMQSVLDHFFELRDNHYHHDRIDRELVKSNTISEKRRKAANTRHHANALQMDTQPQPQPHIKSKPLAQQKTLSDAEAIYDCYPRKVGKRKAIKAITQAMKRLRSGEYKKRELTDAEVVAGLKNRTLMFAQSVAGQKSSFTPHPATWFNRSSYLDDPKEWNDEQPVDNKAVARAINNRDAILAGLGYGGDAATVRTDSGEGFAARGDAVVGPDVLALQSRGAEMGIRGAFADIEILPKTR